MTEALSREEYRDGFRWALLRLLDWETGRLSTRKQLVPETPPRIMTIIERDAVAQVRGE